MEISVTSLQEVGSIVNEPGKERLKADPLAFPEAPGGYGGNKAGPQVPQIPGEGQGVGGGVRRVTE